MFEAGAKGNRTWLFGLAFVAGMGLMLLFDPRRGAARRARVRDRSAANLRHVADRIRRRSIDLQQRLRGALHEARAAAQEQRVPDNVLVERVRAQLGRPVSHARLIEITARDGHLTLLGAILQPEVEGLIARLTKVRGVRDIDSQLEVFETEEEIDRYAGRRGEPGIAEEPLRH